MGFGKKNFKNINSRIPIAIFHLSCTFDQQQLPIAIYINHVDPSKIEIKIPKKYNLPYSSLDTFLSSSAGKRYFSYRESSLDLVITAMIPRRQLSSRYFGDYLIHILTKIYPVMEALELHQRTAKAA